MPTKPRDNEGRKHRDQRPCPRRHPSDHAAAIGRLLDENAWRKLFRHNRTIFTSSGRTLGRVLRYFSGQLLDTGLFELEQQYLMGTFHASRAATVWLELDEGDGFQSWHELASLGNCAPDDPCFFLDRDAALINFGDGEHGRRPTQNARVRGWYRTGAGATGNVAGSPTAIPRDALISSLSEVSHLTWMRQTSRDKGLCYEQLDPTPTDHDRERADETVTELERLGVLHQL
jgi:hypothetical protein